MVISLAVLSVSPAWLGLRRLWMFLELAWLVPATLLLLYGEDTVG